MRALGIMQGRLSPKYQGRYQAFPVDTWMDEFSIAQDLGLDCIEFILDRDLNFLDNPLMNEKGLKQIQGLINTTGVKVLTVCADYFMQQPLFIGDLAQQEVSLKTLKILLKNVQVLGVKDIVIPCVDDSSLHNDPVLLQRFKDALTRVIPLAESFGINLSLETDLAPQPFYDLVRSLNSSAVRINYDTGNSAALGYDVTEEMNCYGGMISTLHIKDRIRNGGSVVLGQGDAKIDLALRQLQKHHYQGPIVLQAYRNEEGIEIFKQQLNWFRPILEKYYPVSLKKA
jgi:L-ribulose-5-phosphate 3-epimerase